MNCLNTKLKITITVMLFVVSYQLFSQKMFKNQETICPLKFELEDEQMFISYEPNDSILIYDFIEGLDDKKITKLKGVIMAQIMVDTAFRVCCVSYTNKSTLNNKKPDIPTRISNMKGWKRNVPEHLANKNICAIIAIYIDKYEYKIQHIGYNRNKGKHLLKSSIYKRKKKHIKK